ncbi:MAG: uncharacterized protein A8A55_2047 [Amphiamblys sp. WSBS2006]|nr:MAG: uncharacterized protein A8A55_2047 [Amphiamblys sp. WSBS2006]
MAGESTAQNMKKKLLEVIEGNDDCLTSSAAIQEVVFDLPDIIGPGSKQDRLLFKDSARSIGGRVLPVVLSSEMKRLIKKYNEKTLEHPSLFVSGPGGLGKTYALYVLASFLFAAAVRNQREDLQPDTGEKTEGQNTGKTEGQNTGKTEGQNTGKTEGQEREKISEEKDTGEIPEVPAKRKSVEEPAKKKSVEEPAKTVVVEQKQKIQKINIRVLVYINIPIGNLIIMILIYLVRFWWEEEEQFIRGALEVFSFYLENGESLTKEEILKLLERKIAYIISNEELIQVIEHLFTIRIFLIIDQINIIYNGCGTNEKKELSENNVFIIDKLKQKNNMLFCSSANNSTSLKWEKKFSKTNKYHVFEEYYTGEEEEKDHEASIENQIRYQVKRYNLKNAELIMKDATFENEFLRSAKECTFGIPLVIQSVFKKMGDRKRGPAPTGDITFEKKKEMLREIIQKMKTISEEYITELDVNMKDFYNENVDCILNEETEMTEEERRLKKKEEKRLKKERKKNFFSTLLLAYTGLPITNLTKLLYDRRYFAKIEKDEDGVSRKIIMPIHGAMMMKLILEEWLLLLGGNSDFWRLVKNNCDFIQTACGNDGRGRFLVFLFIRGVRAVQKAPLVSANEGSIITRNIVPVKRHVVFQPRQLVEEIKRIIAGQAANGEENVFLMPATSNYPEFDCVTLVFAGTKATIYFQQLTSMKDGNGLNAKRGKFAAAIQKVEQETLGNDGTQNVAIAEWHAVVKMLKEENPDTANRPFEVDIKGIFYVFRGCVEALEIVNGQTGTDNPNIFEVDFPASESLVRYFGRI